MRVLELHASCRAIKRSDARSATGASAYITRTAVHDDRTGETLDFRRTPGGVEATGLALEDNAPQWATDRVRLWNSLEQANKRKDAQTAREIEISMPHEYTSEMRKEATLKISNVLLRRYGGAVEWAIHSPSEESDRRNFHTHLLFSSRRFTETGEWAPKGRTVDPKDLPEEYDRSLPRNQKPRYVADCPLDDVKRGPTEMEELRAEIASIQNEIAVREQLPVFIEHLSYERRGIDREAQQHMGRNATAIERKGEVTDISTRNRDITGRNAERVVTRDEIKVIQIDEARERLQDRTQAPPRTQEEIHAAFYAETYARRQAALETYEREHGPQERQMKAEAAEITRSIDGAGFFTRFVRYATGRTQKDQQRLADIQSQLEKLSEKKRAQWDAFEKDRQQSLEKIKLDQIKEEQVRVQQQMLNQQEEQPLARAVGDRPQQQPPAQARPPAPVAAPSLPQQEQPKPQGEYERKQAARREHFRKQGEQRKAERERENVRLEPRRTQDETRSSAPPPTLTQDFGQAAAPIEEDATKKEREAALREVYRRRLVKASQNQQRDRKTGPTRDL